MGFDVSPALGRDGAGHGGDGLTREYMNDALLTAKQAAAFLAVSSCTIYRLVQRRDIPFIERSGLGVRFRKADLDAWLNQASNRRSDSYVPLSALTGPRSRVRRKEHEETGGPGEMAKAKSEARLNLGYGAVYPRPKKDGTVRWYLQYKDHTGKWVYKLAPLAISRDQAIQALKAAVFDEQQKSLGFAPAVEMLFRELAPLYLETHAKPNKRSWRDDARKLHALFVPAFGRYALREITPLMVEQFRAHRLRTGITPATANRELALLKKMFNCAIAWEKADRNPVCKVKFFREMNKRERVLKAEEERRLLEELPSFLKPIVFLAL